MIKFGLELPNGDKRLRRTLACVMHHLPSLESDDAIFERKDRIVTCHFDTNPSIKLAAALTQDNLTGFHHLATVQLNAQPFALGIATVFCRTFGFC